MTLVFETEAAQYSSAELYIDRIVFDWVPCVVLPSGNSLALKATSAINSRASSDPISDERRSKHANAERCGFKPHELPDAL